MRFHPTLRAATRRGAFVAASLFLLGVAGVTQPTVELLAPSKVRVGDTVEIVLRVRNDGPKPIDLELSGRPVGFDIVVTGADGREVWRRLEGTAVAAILMLLTLQPGEARDFTARWGQVDSTGRAVSPGRYVLQGVLPMGRRQMTTGRRDLIIEP
jgi:intracellular proteinase inhibitor BsuPI